MAHRRWHRRHYRGHRNHPNYNQFHSERHFWEKRSTQRTILSFVAAIVISLVSYKITNSALRWLNIIVWFVFAYYLYRGLYRKANKIYLASDLNYITVRLIGVVITGIAGILAFSFYLSMMLVGYDPIVTGILILILGFGGLGLFMFFRTERRYTHIYINRGH